MGGDPLKLSEAQRRVFRQIQAGTYRTTVMDGPTLRALLRKGAIKETTATGYPPTYVAPTLSSPAADPVARSGAGAAMDGDADQTKEQK